MNEIINYWKICVLQNFSNFNGRARRKEYWMFFAANLIAGVGFSILAAIIGNFGNILSIIYSLGILIPGLAVAVRRLHDIGKSWTSLFFILIPIAGIIILIVWMIREGSPEENEYGPNPKSLD